MQRAEVHRAPRREHQQQKEKPEDQSDSALDDGHLVSRFENSVRVCRGDGREMTFDGGGLRADST
jgi:hypothetical protein